MLILFWLKSRAMYAEICEVGGCDESPGLSPFISIELESASQFISLRETVLNKAKSFG